MNSEVKVGDLVWIPDLTHAYDRLGVSHRVNINGPTYGLVLEVSQKNDPSRIRVSLGRSRTPEEFWFKANEIYKQNGDYHGEAY